MRRERDRKVHYPEVNQAICARCMRPLSGTTAFVALPSSAPGHSRLVEFRQEDIVGLGMPLPSTPRTHFGEVHAFADSNSHSCSERLPVLPVIECSESIPAGIRR